MISGAEAGARVSLVKALTLETERARLVEVEGYGEGRGSVADLA